MQIDYKKLSLALLPFLFFSMPKLVLAETSTAMIDNNSHHQENYIEISPFSQKHQDEEMISPKSINIHPYKNKMYINALEAGKTLVYSNRTFEKLKTIDHSFSDHTSLKAGTRFFGKPVEGWFTHDGRYYWVTYYRWSDDANAMNNSGFALIDTDTDQIVRAFPTGNIPKFITANAESTLLSVTLWGENKVELYDISDVANTHLISTIALGPKVVAEAGSNRDNTCGMCLRGTAFIPNSNLLAVAQMGSGGGIWLIDSSTMKVMRGLRKTPATPRHLQVYEDWLYFSANASGMVGRILISDLERAAKDDKFEPIIESKKFGEGARTIKIFKNHIFAALNHSQKVAISNLDFTGMRTLPAPAFPVGLDVDENILAVTSQGRGGEGGHRVWIYNYNALP